MKQVFDWLLGAVNPNAVKEQAIKNQVSALLEGNKEREAFILLKQKAEPEEFLAPGQRPKESFVTLVEDDLR